MNVHPALGAQAALPDLPTRDILGTSVAALAWADALELLRGKLVTRSFTKVGFLNAHNANVACNDPAFAAALDDFLVLPDGVGVDIAARILHGATFPDNLNGTDVVPALIASIGEPITVGLLGATRENAGGAAERLAELAPQHRYVVIHDGFFRPEEEPAILERLAEIRPDILLVAMGVPRQEFWIASHLGPRFCTMPIAVGALLDFLSGNVPRAPEWMRAARAEWVFRLWVEPSRLWRRYVLGNPVFLARVLGQKLTGRRRRPALR